MIWQSIIFALAFSFLIVDTKPAADDLENMEQRLDGLSLFENEEFEEDFLGEENVLGQVNIPEEPQINAPIQTFEEMENILGIVFNPGMENDVENKEEVQKFFRSERKLLKKVEHFLRSEDSEDYSKFNHEVAFGLVHVANLTFWMSTNFRICTLLYSPNSIYSDDQLLADACNTRFNELASAFNYFKEKIKFFFDMATIYGQTYGNDDKVECIAKEVLTLSLDFVLDEDVLQTKQGPDEYVDGMIKWSFIDDTMIDGKAYKTIFPSFKKLFCNCRNVYVYSSTYDCHPFAQEHNSGTPQCLIDTDGNLIPEYRYQNFFGYNYPQFNVCNCRTLEEDSSFSRNDDTGVYDDINVASPSSNRAKDLSSYNGKVQMKNKEIAENIRRSNRNPFNVFSVKEPTMFDMYSFLDILMDRKVDKDRFDLIHYYSTIKIGKGNKLNVTKYATWFDSCFINDVMPMWENVAKIEHDPEENVFSLIGCIRKLDEDVSLRELMLYQSLRLNP